MIAGPDKKDVTTIKTEFKPIKLQENFTPAQIKIGVPQEFYARGLSSDNLDAWNETLEVFSKQSNVKIVPISLPYAPYTMSCYSVLTSCEVASNFSRFDGLKYGYHTKFDINNDKEYDLKKILTKNRDESLGNIVKSRIVSGNYFLLKR
jgi:aspartyl-tRNA(Asn)/glutamyl-tRNA(Gln) amidotransferase subunit A